MVLEYLKKGFEMGLDAARIDKKKARKFAGELVKAGRLTAQEAERFLKDVEAAAKESESRLRREFESELKAKADGYLKRKGYVHKSEVAAMRRRIAELERKLKKRR